MLTEISRHGSLSPRASYTRTKDFKKRDKRKKKKIVTRTERTVTRLDNSSPFHLLQRTKPIKITDITSDGI
jgi:hypothetical protein